MAEWSKHAGTAAATCVLYAALTGAGMIGAGCAASSPRFTQSETREAEEDLPADTVGLDESSYASRIREESSKEDDVRPVLPEVRKKLLGRYSNETPPGVNRDKVLLEVISWLGVPYHHGGMSKEGIDCSGFSSKVYAGGFGIMLPRSTREQFRVGEKIRKSELQFGDLVFFNTTGRRPSHVGVYIEDDLFAHASVNDGVTISSLESTYYRKRFVGARRPAADLSEH